MAPEEIDWPKLLEEAGLPRGLEPLYWQRQLVEEYLAGRPLYFPGGRQAGRSTAVRLLRAADELYG